MKRERYRTTLCGRRASRRITWYQPKGLRQLNGQTFVDTFVVLRVNEDAQIELVAVSSQLGIDKRGRHVLPGNIVAPKNAYHGDPRIGLAIYACAVPVGKLEATGKAFAETLNKSLQRGDMCLDGVADLTPATIAAPWRVNDLKEVR